MFTQGGVEDCLLLEYLLISAIGIPCSPVTSSRLGVKGYIARMNDVSGKMVIRWRGGRELY